MANLTSKRKKKYELRLEELLADRADVKAAIKKILQGDAQSYGVGTRNKSAYAMNLTELRNMLKVIEDEIAEIESILDGGGPRFVAGFVPCDY